MNWNTRWIYALNATRWVHLLKLNLPVEVEPTRYLIVRAQDRHPGGHKQIYADAASHQFGGWRERVPRVVLVADGV